MSASDALSLAGIKKSTFLADALPDRESMVAIKGEVPSYDTDQPPIDPLSSGTVRKAFPSKDDNSTSWASNTSKSGFRIRTRLTTMSTLRSFTTRLLQ